MPGMNMPGIAVAGRPGSSARRPAAALWEGLRSRRGVHPSGPPLRSSRLKPLLQSTVAPPVADFSIAIPNPNPQTRAARASFAAPAGDMDGARAATPA